MATVQSLVLRFLAKADPYMKDGTAIASGNISTWNTNGGDRFTATQIISFYNEARIALFNAIQKNVSRSAQLKLLDGLIATSNVTFSLATNDNYYRASLPTGFLREIDFYDAYNDKIVDILPNELFAAHRGSLNELWTPASGRNYVFIQGDYLIDPTGVMAVANVSADSTGTITTAAGSPSIAQVAAPSITWSTKKMAGGTLLTAGSQSATIISYADLGGADYVLIASDDVTSTETAVAFRFVNWKLTYFKLADITASDITGGTATEPYRADFHPILLELMVAIANEQGALETNAMAEKLLGIVGAKQ